MKTQKFQLAGFSNYNILNTGVIVDAKTGTPVKQTAKQKEKGIFELTASEDSESSQVKAGEKVKYNIADLLKLEGIVWEDVETPQTEGAKTDATPLSEADQKKADYKKKHKELKDAVNKAKAYLSNEADTAEQFAEGKAKRIAAEEALAAFEKENEEPGIELTEEQKAIVADYEGTKDDIEAFTQLITDLKAKVKAQVLPEGYKAKKRTGSTSGDEVPQRAPKLNYEKAQELRKDISEGMTVKDVCTKYNVTPFAVKCIANYTNYKLKEGDTAYTPLPVKGEPGVPATDVAEVTKEVGDDSTANDTEAGAGTEGDVNAEAQA